MKLKNLYLAIVVAAVIMGCGSSTEDIKEQSKETLIESISETAGISESEIKVTDYSLIKAGDNKYEGVLQTEIQGMNQTFDVIVKVDPETDEFLVEWELLNEY